MERLGIDSTTAAAHEEDDDEQIAKAKKKARAKEKKEKLKLREAKVIAISPRELTKKQKEKYHKMEEESDGFDVPYFGKNYVVGIRPRRYMDIETMYKCIRYAKLAIADYNKREGTHFKFAKLIKVNSSFVAGFIYYITFEVKPDGAPDDDDDDSRNQVFQANVWDGITELHVQLCRPKPGSTLVKQPEEDGAQVHNISKQGLKDDVDTMVAEPSSSSSSSSSSSEYQLLNASMKKMEKEMNNLKVELRSSISSLVLKDRSDTMR